MVMVRGYLMAPGLHFVIVFYLFINFLNPEQEQTLGVVCDINSTDMDRNHLLVRFPEDGVFFLCKKSKKTFKKYRGSTMVKWSDEHFYQADILAKGSRQDLSPVLENLVKGVPIVLTENMRMTSYTERELPVNAQALHFVNSNEPEMEKHQCHDQLVCRDAEKSDEEYSNNMRMNNSYTEKEQMGDTIELVEYNEPKLTMEQIEIRQDHTDHHFDYEDEAKYNDDTIRFSEQLENTAILDLVVCTDCGLMVPEIEKHQCCSGDLLNLENVEKSEGNIQGRTFSGMLCNYCGLIIMEDLKSHIVMCHDGDGDGVYEEVLDNKCSKTQYGTKQHFCMFCKSLQTKLARHLERQHSGESQVLNALQYPKGSIKRRSIFASIQKEGDFIHNSDRTREKYIDVRRCHKSSTTERIPCPFCKGFYSKKNLRNHVRMNCKSKPSNKQNVQVLSRTLVSKVHENASESLRSKIFPPMRDDHITKAVAHDELVIAFANLLVTKYSASEHHHNMIRSKIRHIGRILIEMKRINPAITDVKSIYDPSNFDTFVKSVHNLSGFKDGKYDTPSFGPSSVTLISQIGDVLQVEAIKKKDDALEKDAQRFLKLLTTTSNSLICKAASENRTQNQRSKVVILPKTDDVKKLFNCLNEKIRISLENLKLNFDINSWTNLSKALLVNIMIFNRKRPGDIEKSQIIEFKNVQMVDDDTMDKLDHNDKQYATTLGRYITRGKLDCPAPVLVSLKDIEALKMVMKFRRQANVDENNPYLFAAPIGYGKPYFKAGKVLSEFCLSEGLNKNLTATKLRKHLATVTSTLSQSEQAIISDFMGHAINIHNKIYRQRPVIQDVVQMGKFLHGAMNMDIGESVIYDKIVDGNAVNLNVSADQTEIGASDENSACFQEFETNYDNSSSGLATSDEDPTYEPNLSTIAEGEDESSEETVIRRKNISSITRPSHTRRFIRKRSTWTTPERRAAREVFCNYLNPMNEAVPTLETCQEFIHKNDDLKNRAPVQVRAWIISEKKRFANRNTNSKKTGWDTPMREVCRRHFEKYYSTESYPSKNELQNAIDSYEELNHVTVEKLRSHIQHDFKYLKKKSISST